MLDMFHHVKELQFNARVSRPDPKFATLLLEQFGGANGELKAAMTYFIQAFACKKPYPDKYDLLMDIATEEFSHLEIVGATITMLLDGVNGDLKDAAERSEIMKLMKGRGSKEEVIQQNLLQPQFLTSSGGGPTLTNSAGVPFNGNFIDSNGDLTVDLRSDIAAESRAKIVYEYLLQFTDDPYVQESLRFLMTREIAHFQMFSAALDTIQPNFPPGILQGDPRFTHAYYNMSNGASVRGPWNQGQGPWKESEEWEYIEDPISNTRETKGGIDKPIVGTSMTLKEAASMEEDLGKERSSEIARATSAGAMQWSDYEGPAEEANQSRRVTGATSAGTRHVKRAVTSSTKPGNGGRQRKSAGR
jgi:Mn-containing catalase